MRATAGVCLGLVLAAVAAGQNTASVQGTVSDEGGRAVTGVKVTLHRVAGPAPDNREADTPADGSFEFPNLPAGRYVACVQAPGSLILNPCEWTPEAPPLDLAAGQARRGVQLRVARGALVQVRVNDPSRLLPADLAGAGIHILAGVAGPNGLFHTAFAARDSQGWTFSLAGPRETALNMSLHARGVRLADESGTSVGETGAASPFTVPAGGTGRSFTFNVVGTR